VLVGMTGMRIAMWSGPRSLSTVMLRAWESRPDTAVSDEPFYACFLAATGADRPGREESMASQPHEWMAVLDQLRGEVPGGRAIWFQKHHAMHLLPAVPRDWIPGLTNFFLVRHPVPVALSYQRIRPAFSAEDLGIRQLRLMFDFVRDRSGAVPVVVDAADLARDPRRTLEVLCAALGVGFREEMLSWPPGRHPEDPSVGDPWYDRVQRSSGFLAPGADGPGPQRVPADLRGRVDACLADYGAMAAHRLCPVSSAAAAW
jgi:hypothetical protein